MKYVRQRKTMTELFGIDRCTSQCAHSGLAAHERSLVSALQSGSFIDAWTHGRFDLAKDRLRSCCEIPETHKHLAVCPKFFQIRDNLGLSISEIQQWPSCTAQYFLVPKSPHLDELRRHLCREIDSSFDFVSAPTWDDIRHLFTDGSSFGAGRPELRQAAWGVYNHTSHLPVATGFVPRLLQTIDRVEVLALLAAQSWTSYWRCNTHVWLDSFMFTAVFRKGFLAFAQPSMRPTLISGLRSNK